ncbi:2-succinyl-6-hydroxy-2,4-cyclohexadiene-1-carboxylate synthase [Tumidithrix elongata RA019]|uniref:Putative 2-succinyl-6-hydroxy-2,4-cyclohexadiene-1-carboxylate synthase n=1 Tax=Tumidithrix elongata BACA0141 TaxID=2716417 RepID=A0AAW9Q6I3_9CYAN|nr:2-succinyl-6-hydroxy-2,4-cyclohexadiene-1-carboxylate synthase [Tumidithrix elongata RA019]
MERSLQVTNYIFHYYASGNSSHPAILFLHGFMGDRYEFKEVIARLCERFYCLAIDLPGHGETQVTGGDRNFEMMPTANGIVQFLEALNIGQCFLVGYSMGGRLALYLTLYFPQYFRKAVLESASPGLKTEMERIERLQSDRKLARELENGDLFSFLVRWYNQALFASTKAHPDFERMLAKRSQNSPTNLAKSLCNLSTGKQPSLWDKLQNNQIPLLLLAGELDRKFVALNTEMVYVSGSERTKENPVRLEIISNCGHNIHFENPAIFTPQVSDFLSRSSGEAFPYSLA